MSAVDPTHQLFWFASRAVGIVALIALAVSVALGLAMSARLTRRPGLPAQVRHFHESLTLVTLGVIAVHGGPLYSTPGCDLDWQGSRSPSRWATGPCSPAWASSPDG